MRSKILIVDDMELNREMLTAILEDEYPVVEAESGKKAIEILEELQDEVAVVLLDLIMPDMDGYEVLEEMRRRLWMDKIPVLVISAESKVAADGAKQRMDPLPCLSKFLLIQLEISVSRPHRIVVPL